MPSYFFWKMRATPGACIKPGCFARRPLCHKANLLSCVARRPLFHKVNLPRCEARRRHFIMTCDIFGTGQTNILALCYLFGKTWPKNFVNCLHFNSVWTGLFKGGLREERGVSAKFEFRSESFILSTSWCLDALKNNGENYPKKCFWTKDKGNLG